MNHEIIQTQVTTFGMYDHVDESLSQMQVHCHYKLIYILSGRIKYIDRNNEIILGPDCYYILPDRIMYSLENVEISENEPLRYALFYIISRPNLCDTVREFPIEKNEILKNYTPFLLNITDDCGVGAGENKYSTIHQSTVNLVFNILHLSDPFVIKYDKSTADVIDYINENIDKDLTNEVLAKIAMMSKSNFIKHFTNQIKKTPQKYILDIRMTMALKLLNENHKIEDICEKIGYEYISSFNRSFKKLFHRTPKECISNLYKNAY